MLLTPPDFQVGGPGPPALLLLRPFEKYTFSIGLTWDYTGSDIGIFDWSFDETEKAGTNTISSNDRPVENSNGGARMAPC